MYPGANIDSDYNLVMIECRVVKKKLQKKLVTRRWDVEKLKDTNRKLEF